MLGREFWICEQDWCPILQGAYSYDILCIIEHITLRRNGHKFKMTQAAPYNLFNKQEIYRAGYGSSFSPEALTTMSRYGEQNGYYLLIAIQQTYAGAEIAKPIYRPFDYIRRPNYWNMLLGPSGGIWKTLDEAKSSFGSLTHASSSSVGDAEDGSDKWWAIWGTEAIKNTSVTFYRLAHSASPTARGKKSAVHAFNFSSASNYDLKTAQIYQPHELASCREDRITHCLLFAMKQAGVSESIVDSTAYACLSGGAKYVSVTELKKVVIHIQRPIKLSRVRLCGKKSASAIRVETIGEGLGQSPAIDLAVYENHIFHNPIVDVNVHILKKSIQPDYAIPPRARISRKPLLWVVHQLHTLGAFTMMSPDQHNEGRDEAKDDFIKTVSGLSEIKMSSECLDINQREFKHQDRKMKEEVYFAADCESFTGQGATRHELALLGITKVCDPCNWASADIKIWSFKEDPVKSMIRYVYHEVRGHGEEDMEDEEGEKEGEDIDDEYQEFEDHIAAVEEKSIPIRRKRKRDNGACTAVIFFHNLRYDRAVLQRDLSIFEVLEYDNSTYFMKIRYANLTIEFRDSWKHLDMSLSMMSTALNLPDGISKKECGINYDYFTVDNFGSRCVVDTYVDLSVGKFTRTDIAPILNQTSQFDVETDSINPWQLYRYYLHFDVIVLACALHVYQTTGMELASTYLRNVDLDPLSFVTKSSFSKSLARHGGVFDGSFEYCGSLRRFIMSSIRGGRVACHPEFEGKITYASASGIIYMDAVSEYPSAMVQMCDDYGGFPTGPASLMESIDCIGNPDTFYYIARIRITAIPRKMMYSYPIIAYKSPDSETVDYIQDLPDGKPFEVTIGKIDLEEYIRFHDIQFEFIDGVKWSAKSPPNPEWGNMIKHLFEQRKVYKKAGNTPMSNMIKNNMNSQYGSSIPKIKEYGFSMLSKGRPDLEQALANIFHSVVEFYDLGKTLQLKRTKLDMSYTSCLFGSIVLCMSRRINNRLLYALEHCQVYALYGDTDSCMFDSQFLPLIRTEYKRLWSLDLEGSELGQFHSDFEAIPGCIDNDAIRSSKMWLVGKKIYCHETYGPGPNNTTVYGRQYKCKGVPKKAIDYAATVLNPLDFNDGISQLYDQLIPQSSDYDADGVVIDRSISFLCNPYGSVRFVYAKDRTVMTPTEPFFRKVSRKPLREFNLCRL